MIFDTLLSDKSNNVALVTLNSPEQHNASICTMMYELDRRWDDIRCDPEVVAVVTGAGNKAFYTGMDLSDVSPEKIDELYCGSKDFCAIAAHAAKNRR